MTTLEQLLSTYMIPIILINAALLVLAIILLLYHTIVLSRMKRKYKRLTRGIENKNFEGIFVEHLDKLEQSMAAIQAVAAEMTEVQNKLKFCIQKVGFVRYNPFQDVGGDMSFSIALLNESDEGVVITGLYSRNGSSLFSKWIDQGLSASLLSEEEKEAIRLAKANK